MDRVEREISVELVFSPRAGALERQSLYLPEGSTVARALERSGRPQPADLLVGVWGRPCALDQTLRHGDRVELYRSLTVDPKEARRLRHRSQLKSNSR